jgi:hypothetical protein
MCVEVMLHEEGITKGISQKHLAGLCMEDTPQEQGFTWAKMAQTITYNVMEGLKIFLQ